MPAPKNYVTVEGNVTHLPPDAKKIFDYLNQNGISAIIAENLVSTEVFHDEKDDDTPTCVSVATYSRVQTVEAEDRGGVETGVAAQREIRTILLKVRGKKGKGKKLFNNRFFTVSFRSNRRFSSTDVRKIYCKFVGIGISTISINMASDNDLKQLGLQGGLINPFIDWLPDIEHHFCDGDLFKEYYLGELLTTNCSDRSWSVQISMKREKERLQKNPKIIIPSNPLFIGGPSQTLSVLNKVVETPIHLIAYDQQSLAQFLKLFNKRFKKRIIKLPDMNDSSGARENIEIPFSGLFSAPMSITTHQFTEFGAAMYPLRNEAIQDVLVKIIKFIQTSEKSVLLVPCNIIPEYLATMAPTISLVGTHISMSSALHNKLESILEPLITDAVDTKPKVGLLAGSKVVQNKDSIYRKMLTESPFSEYMDLILPNQRAAKQIDNAMLRYQSGDYERAYEVVVDVIKDLPKLDVLVIASTSISLLLERDEIDVETLKTIDPSRPLIVLDLFEQYSSFCVDQIIPPSMGYLEKPLQDSVSNIQ